MGDLREIEHMVNNGLHNLPVQVGDLGEIEHMVNSGLTQSSRSGGRSRGDRTYGEQWARKAKHVKHQW